MHSSDGYVIMEKVRDSAVSSSASPSAAPVGASVGAVCSCGVAHSTGSYRVIGDVGAQVRESIGLDTLLITTLITGTVIEVVEVDGRRARIAQPTNGWVSIHGGNGYDICKKSSEVNKRMRVVGEAGATLRKTDALDSELLRTLNTGDVVLAVETRGRRVRVIEPALGWCSVVSAEGYVILRDI